jgi:hypothetical protein
VKLSQRIEVPEWVASTPKACFVGISRACKSIEEARQEAIHSALAQILQAMGAEYILSHKSELSGDLRRNVHELDETLTYTARWFVQRFQQNIEKSAFRQVGDRYVCFVLIKCPPGELDRLRKLSVGPKVAAELVQETQEYLFIEIRENNGVEVTFTDYEIEIKTLNRHAEVITMFLWKVPESSIRGFNGILKDKISVQGASKRIRIPNLVAPPGLRSLIFGEEYRISVTLNGYDETGRSVSIRVNAF